jgi:integrase
LAKGIYKRGNVWWIRYAGLDGKTRYESSNSTYFKVAQSLLIDRKKDIKEGKEPLAAKRIGNNTFRKLAEEYLPLAKRQESYNTKKYFIKDLIKSFGNRPLRKFTTKNVWDYHNKILSSGRTPATANRHLATLKHMFTMAVEWELVEEEVLKRIRRVKFEKEDNERIRFLAKDELHALLKACAKSPPYLRPIIITAVNTGLRKSNILSLKWEDNIDLKHGFILLPKTKNGSKLETPINQTLRETLKNLPRRLDSPYVFTDSEGKKIKDIKRSFKSALRRAGIKDFRFHDLRHTFASHLVMAGVDIVTVRKLMGHKSIKMTLRYAHLAPSHNLKAVEKLGNAFEEKPNYTKNYTIPQKKELAI